ncbi:MAG: hypothetical protein A3J49_16235 [Gallionellales bacterium RIFCSPHIGHO2_02_FULL_57_16]|nr:MAG: hypothetical protein A3J49_16235 [Gallionellales bacterium RIFCSPHIGHO2_02_FULL_57_16]
MGISPAAYASIAGHVQFVSGEVQITNPAGQIRPAQKGDAINEGDTLTSAQKSSAQIKMQDGGFVAVRPDTRLKFDQFVFAGKEDGSEKSFFSLFKGGFRAVTGLIGNLNKQNYKITTPAATIGIRGTDHETFLITPDSPLARVAPVGAYNKVNVGETYVATDKGTIFVQPNQMGFAGGMDQMPKVQPINTKIFTVAEAATPEAKAEKKEEKEEKTEAKQEEKVAKGDKEEKKEEKKEEAKAETTAEGGATTETTQGATTAAATQEETAPVRETAVVDATAPATGGAPAAAAPTVTTTTTVVAAPPPPAPTTVLATATVTGGTIIDITAQTGTNPTTGVTQPITNLGISGTAAYLFNNPLVTPGTNVTVTDAATIAQLANIDAANGAGTLTYAAIGDTLANLTTNAGGYLTGAINATVLDAVVVADLAPIVAMTTGTVTAAILKDTVTNLAPTGVASVHIGNGSNVTVTDAASIAQLTAIDGANGAGILAYIAVSDLAATLATNTGGYVAAGKNVTVTDAASIAQLAAIDTINTTGIVTATAVSDTAAALAGNAGGYVAAGTNVTVTDAASIAQLVAIDTANVAGTLTYASIADTTANLTANTNGYVASGTNVTVTDAASIAQLTTIDTANTTGTLVYTTVGDTATNLIANTGGYVGAGTNVAVTNAANLSQLATIDAANGTGAVSFTNVTNANAEHRILFDVPVTGGVNEGWIYSANPSLTANSSYLFDGNNNLTGITNTPYRTYDQVASLSSIIDADIQFVGGTSYDKFTAADNSIYMGRWAGGSMLVTDLALTAPVAPFNVSAGTSSTHWVLAQVVPEIAPGISKVQNMVGTTTYTMSGVTRPTDSFGNVGSVTAATLTANFTAQTVATTATFTFSQTDPVNISAKNMVFDISQPAMPITGSIFADTWPNVTTFVSCTGADCTTGFWDAWLDGSIAGDTGMTAFVDYYLYNRPNSILASGTPYTDMVRSIVAFNTSTAPTVGVNPPAGTLASFGRIAAGSTGAWERGRFNVGSMPQTNTNFVLDASGNLVRALRVQYNERPTWGAGTSTNNYANAAVSYSGGVANDFYQTPDGSITIGRWTGGQMTIDDNLGMLSPLVKNLGSNSSAWMYWAPPATGYVQTLVGTTTYTQVGATLPTDTFGNVGTLPVATLSANFTNQTINTNVAFSIASQNLTVTATGVPIPAGGDYADAMLELGTAPSVICTGTCAGGYLGALTANIAGSAAMSADVHYMVWPTAAQGSLVTDIIQGIVAFTTTTAPSVATNPPAGNWSARGHMLLGSTATGWARGRFNAGNFGDLPATNFILDGAGNLVRSLHVFYNERYVQNALSQAANQYADAMVTYSGGVASDYFTDGSVAIGRWTGGQMIIADNLGALPTLVNNLGVTSSYWTMTSQVPVNYVQSLIGTTTYTQAGATLPTDSLGNVGTLPVATLSANFTNQTVDASVAFTIANQGLTIANPAIPIVAGTEFFEGVIELGTAPTVSCTGTGCAVPGYLGWLTGGFAGATASSANLAYKIWPTAAADSLVSDLIQGIVAFNTATAPTVNPTGVPLAAYAATDTSVAYTGAYGGNFNFIAAPGDLTLTPDGPTTFTENFGSGWGSRTDVLNGASTATPPTTTANGITFGVWDTVTSVNASQQYPIWGSSSHSYMYGAEGYLDSAVTAGMNTGPLVGTFTYNQVAMTSYDTSTWTDGTATSATMSANFTSQTVSVGLAGTMGTTSWTSTSANIPITFMNLTAGTGASFNNSAPAITVNTVACPTCGGNINGSFVGQNFAGAIVQYNVWDNNNLNVDGSVAFDRMPVGTNPAVTNGTPNPSMTTFVLANNSSNIERPTAITTDAGGVLTGWGVTNVDGSFNSTVTPAADSIAQTAVGTGSGTINWGQWGAGSVKTNTFSYVPGVAQLHWITAPEPTPVYLAEALTTTNAVYNFVGGDVTSLVDGTHGTVNGTTSLAVNFTAQTVAVNLALVENNGYSWLASTPNAPLRHLSQGNSMTGFSADSYRLSSQPGYLTVTVDIDGTGPTAPIAASGSMAGQLVGAALDGAILKFNLGWVQGVAALAADAATVLANDPATQYRGMLTSISDPMALAPTVTLGGTNNNAARFITDASGNLTQFDYYPFSGNGNGETIQYAGAGTGAGFVDQGSAVIGGETVSWGRWDAGTVVNVQDRATQVWQSGIVLTGGAHSVVGPIATGPVSLPVSGTYTYNKIGNTLPTDQAGVAGTLNSATLSANFTAQTVDVGVNVTAGGATLNAAATNVAIQQRASFYTDSRMTGAGALAVSCTAGACGTTNHGAIVGGFGGAGGALAGISYGFEKGGANAGTVNGVAVFQRGAAIP